MGRFTRLLLVSLAALLLQGCSAVRLGYNNADSLARWWIDQSVDLSSDQDAVVRELLARFHAWHRKTQLPDYATAASQAQQLIAGQATAKDILGFVDGIIHRARTLTEQATPDVADFLLTLKPAQIERMAVQFAEKNVAFAEEIQLADGTGGQRKAQFRRVLERTESWFGEFGDVQKAALWQVIEDQPIGTQFWYDERLRRQREWLDLVRLVQRERPPRERVMQLLREYAAQFDLPNDPARLLQAQALRRNSAELFLAILGVATPAQKAHAQHKLEDLIEDFTLLSREGSP